MRNSLALFATVASLALMGAGVARAADNFLITLDDLTDTIYGNTYQNGTLIQSVGFAGDGLFSAYGLWNNATLSASFDDSYNVYDADGVTLSDTLEFVGTAGDTFFSIAFNSDNSTTPLVALPGGLSLTETGAYQSTISGVVSNGDFYDIQFRSGEVPEPATWALMLLGFGGLGVALRAGRRRGAVA